MSAAKASKHFGLTVMEWTHPELEGTQGGAPVLSGTFLICARFWSLATKILSVQALQPSPCTEVQPMLCGQPRAQGSPMGGLLGSAFVHRRQPAGAMLFSHPGHCRYVLRKSPDKCFDAPFWFALLSKFWLHTEADVQKPPHACESWHPSAVHCLPPTPSAPIYHPAVSGFGMWRMKSGKMMKNLNLCVSCSSHKLP